MATSGLVLAVFWLIAAAACMSCLVIVWRWSAARRRGRRQRVIGQGRYRGKRVIHCADGSVLGAARLGLLWRFGSFDDYRRYVDRR